MWSCTKNRKHLNAYLDDELANRTRYKVERHLAECPDCHLEFERTRGLASLLMNDKVPPLPAGLSDRIVAEATIRQKRKAVEKSSRWEWRDLLFQPWPARGLTTVALFFGLAMGTWMGWTSQQGSRLETRLAAATHENIAGTIYAFDVLSAQPRGSIEAATLILLADGR